MTAVRVERDGAVIVVTIDRPERRNAVDNATSAALAAAFRGFDRDEAAAVAVLTGAGGTFCAGADLQALAAGQAALPRASGDGPMGPTWLELGKPVIAAVEGHAVAGGLELALWCDLRVAARDAVFGVYNRRFGVPLCDLGTVRLPRLIGHGNAMDLILTGRAVEATEAARIGLVNRLVEPGEALETAVRLAHELAAFPQTCLRNDRASAIGQWGLGWEAARRNELAHAATTFRSGEAAAGAAAFARGAGRHGGAIER